MLFAALVTVITIVQTAVPSVTPLRVMPVGDSLTAIPHYRSLLLELASTNGFAIELVGPTKDGARGGHAGMSGASIEQVSQAMKANLDLAKPNVVLLMVGTNNMNHGLGLNGAQAEGYPRDAEGHARAAMFAEPLNGSYLNGVGQRWGDPTYGTTYLAGQLDKIIEVIATHDTEVRVVISTIPPVATGALEHASNNENCSRRITEYNALIAAAAKRAAERYPGRITAVDPFTNVQRGYGVPPRSDFGPELDQRSDWVHPKPDSPVWKSIANEFYAAFKAPSTTRPVGNGGGQR